MALSLTLWRGLSVIVRQNLKAMSGSKQCDRSQWKPIMKMGFLPIALACTLFTTVALAGQRYVEESLPNLGEPSETALSPSEAQHLGRQAVSQLYKAHYIIDDSQLDNFLDRIGWRLAYYGSRSPPDFHFYPIANSAVNAFAMPGANIGVNTGTIVAARTESELAAVMAHEEAHVTQHHIAREAHRSPFADIATWAVALAGMAAAQGDPNAIVGGVLAAESANAQRQINYSRSIEMEADNIGIRTLARAGFNPMAMADFFGRMEQNVRLYGYIPPLLLDHPVDSTRIAEATSRAEQYPPYQPRKSLTFQLMRARARVLQSVLPGDAVTYYARELAAGHRQPGVLYGYALALQQNGQYADALHAMQPLQKNHAHQRNVALLQADLLFAVHRTGPALTIDRQVLATNPQYTPAILQTARQLIAAGKPQQARQLLLSSTQSFGIKADTYRLLARAARKKDNIAEAAYERANYLAARFDFVAAVEILNAALRNGSLSPDDQARLRAKRTQLLANVSPDQLRRLKQEAP